MKTLLKDNYTKYEIARILGARALQISANAPILLKLSKEQLEEMRYDPIKIAESEFEAGILPISIRRPLPKKKEGVLEFREIIASEDLAPERKEEKTEASSEEA
jgi:DNA-directed RNA polymerase subunit K